MKKTAKCEKQSPLSSTSSLVSTAQYACDQSWSHDRQLLPNLLCQWLDPRPVVMTEEHVNLLHTLTNYLSLPKPPSPLFSSLHEVLSSFVPFVPSFLTFIVRSDDPLTSLLLYRCRHLTVPEWPANVRAAHAVFVRRFHT